MFYKMPTCIRIYLAARLTIPVNAVLHTIIIIFMAILLQIGTYFFHLASFFKKSDKARSSFTSRI